MPDPKLLSRDNARGWQPILRASEIEPFPVRLPEYRSRIFRKENCVAQWIRRPGFSIRDNPPRTSSNMMARGRGLECWGVGVEWREDRHCAPQTSPPDQGFPG